MAGKEEMIDRNPSFRNRSGETKSTYVNQKFKTSINLNMQTRHTKMACKQ